MKSRLQYDNLYTLFEDVDEWKEGVKDLKEEITKRKNMEEEVESMRARMSDLETDKIVLLQQIESQKRQMQTQDQSIKMVLEGMKNVQRENELIKV